MKRVVADTPVEAHLDVSVPLIRAPEVWTDFVYRGAGVTIAVLDTGVDYTHADLGGCFGPGCKVAGGYDMVNGDADPIDDNGHGTHCAATAAGDGLLQGVALDATVLAYKVLNAGGFGVSSWIIAGIERATDPNDDGDPSDHVDVISMSLGGSGSEDDPQSRAIDAATEAGVLSVISAGNRTRPFSIGSPGTARTALTVGSTDDLDQIAGFSSRGPTHLDSLLKPEITAPGVNICAARLPTGYSGLQCIDAQHAALSGTSMAAPHVSGAAALLLGANPDLSPAEAKAILQHSAVPLGLNLTTGGAGRLDIRAAMDVQTVLSPTPINLGTDDSTDPTWSRTATVAVRNLSPTPRTYTLSFDGSDMPAGVTAQVEPDEVSVAAGASAEVSLTVTVDNAIVPASSLPPFLHSGRLVASAPGAAQSAIVSFARTASLMNDFCEDAIEVGPGLYGAVALTGRATTSPSDPIIPCGCLQNGRSIWYRITPTLSGTVKVDTARSEYVTMVAAYSGECGALKHLACGQDLLGTGAQVSFDVKAGRSYYLEIASWCSTEGGRLNLEIEVPRAGQAVSEPFTEVFRASASDLEGSRLTFAPEGASYSACFEHAQDYSVPHESATVLGLVNNSFVEMSLDDGQTFPFFGESYDRLFVGSNGYVTFRDGTVDFGPTFLDFFDLPRIAPFSTNLLPGFFSTGRVKWEQLEDRAVVTWNNVQSLEGSGPLYPFNRYQAELFFDGRIRMTILQSGQFGVTGLSPGDGPPPLFANYNFSAVPHCDAPAGGEIPLEGKRLDIQENPSRPTKNQLQLTLGKIEPAQLPALGSAGDPTAAGASIEIYGETSGEFTAIPLPAAGWTATSHPTRGVSYAYRDKAAAFGPCSRVDVSARGVKAKCGRGPFGYTLNENHQFELGGSLTMGSTSTGTRFCSVFGGAVYPDDRGRFSAKRAPVPERCSLPESYY